MYGVKREYFERYCRVEVFRASGSFLQRYCLIATKIDCSDADGPRAAITGSGLLAPAIKQANRENSACDTNIDYRRVIMPGIASMPTSR